MGRFFCHALVFVAGFKSAPVLAWPQGEARLGAQNALVAGDIVKGVIE